MHDDNNHADDYQSVSLDDDDYYYYYDDNNNNNNNNNNHHHHHHNGAGSARPHDDTPSSSEPSSRVSSLDSGSRRRRGRSQLPYSPVPDVSDEEEGDGDDDGRGGGYYSRVPAATAGQRLSWMSDLPGDGSHGVRATTSSPPPPDHGQQQQQRDSATTLASSDPSSGGDGGGGGGDAARKKDASYEIAQVSTDGDAAARGRGGAEGEEPKWTPFHLRRPFLLGFAVVWTLMIVALEVLYFFSERDGGLATVEESLHYLWTYGPTFVLTMAAALWGQVEHSAKQIMPWSLMSRGRTVAEHSLLLNYLTSSMPGSLIRSLRRGHFAVSIGISGSLVVRLLIIFSTGLLSLEYRSVVNDKGFVFQDSVNLAKSVGYTSESSEKFRPLSNSVNFWAILDYNLSYPHGATSQYALQSFAPSENGSYINVTTDVQVFEATLENCETFNFTYDTGGSANTFGISWYNAVPKHYWSEFEQWCYEDHVTYGTSGSVADGKLNEFQNITQHIYKCTNSSQIEEQEDRILITLDSWLSNDLAEISGIMCEPTYSLTRRTVTNVTGSTGIEDGLNVSAEVKETLDLGTRPFNITSNIIDSMEGERPSGVFDIEASVWYTLLNTTQPQSSMQAFGNTSLVAELSKSVFSGYAAYTVKKDFMDPSNETANGTVVFTENRLCVQELSLRLMEALLALLTLLSIALCFLSPGVFHRDPRSVGAHALILARSPGLMQLLSGYGASSKQALKSRLSGHTALFPQRSSPEDAAILVTPQDPTKSELEPAHTGPDELEQRRWWHPMAVTWWFRSALIAAAIGIIVALEVLLQSSEKHNGLGDVDLAGYQKYAWTFVPTLVMATIGLAFSMVDSTARTLHPFHQLRRGNASFRELLYDPAGQVSLVAAGRAAWKRHFALLAIMLTGLLAPVLTIVTSGLYTAEPVPWTRNVTLQMQDWFDIENRTVNNINMVDGDDGEAWTVFQLLQFSNLSYPQWTHGEYAFSSFAAEDLRGYDNDGESNGTTTNEEDGTASSSTAMSIRARLPAVRANLNCSLLHYYTDANFTYNIGDYSVSRQTFIPIDPPAGCHTSHYSSNKTGERQLWLSPDTAIGQDGGLSPNGPFVAHLADDYATVSLAWEDAYIGAQAASSISLCGDGRQHLFYGAGSASGEHGELYDEFALLHCAPYVQALFVTADLSLPDLNLLESDDGEPPLVPDEDSAAFLSASASATAIADSDFDTFAAALVNGSVGGVGELASLVGRANVETFRERLEALYAVYVAQKLHFNYRRALDPAAANATAFLFAANESSSSSAAANSTNAPGTMETFVGGGADRSDAVLTDRTRLRLKQSAVSTRILEGLVAAMAVCLVVAAVLEGLTFGAGGGRVLPKDPGSVAAKMSLFAETAGRDEAWRREVPAGAERWADRVLVRRGVFEGWVFGLGWWGDGEEEGARRRFGVDVGRADRGA